MIKRLWAFISTGQAYGTLATIAILVSLFGLPFAVAMNDPSHGGRGGAIGCAITFFLLFLGKSTPIDALERPSRDGDDVLGEAKPATEAEIIDQLHRLKKQVLGLRASSAALLDGAERERFYVLVASLFCTLMWGFGDIFAKWLIQGI
ncbi:MAG: hypothetical protein ACKOQ3_12260 [Novosphingobium sp.]